ncbi:hypothetical protein [Mycolicibacterium baixiangningiae]|uniref:hypothetical protein n=1 Tax=Mycolicibacterium baixiangningiae TaxID=2761578 RepID=UPI001866CFEE|nr:hypothetical protein [Mycolicibacterium baixiangningiae]
MADLQNLSEEVAEAILAQIRDTAPRHSGGEALAHLANAYATVVGAMPRPKSGGRNAVTA